MSGEPEVEQIRWDVGAGEIDLDRWAKAVVKASFARDRENAPRYMRWGTWPIVITLFFLLAIGFAALRLFTPALAACFLAFIFLYSVLSAPRRVARNLRALPAASEPFTFIATAAGAYETSPSCTSQTRWSRFKSVSLVDGLVVITRDSSAVQVLPAGALQSSQSPEHAVAQMRAWIDADRSTPVSDFLQHP